MKLEPQTIAARRQRLQEWIDTHYHGSQSAFVAATGVNQGELSGLLKTKSFGEKRAATLEIAAKMPNGFLVSPLIPLLSAKREEAGENCIYVQHLDVEAGMGDECSGTDYPEVIGEIAFNRNWLRGELGITPRAGRLVLINGRGDSMLPTIRPDDLLLVDRDKNYYDGDGIYLINLGHGLQVKRLTDRGASLFVCSDNPLYEAFPMPESAVIMGRVHIKHRFERLA